MQKMSMIKLPYRQYVLTGTSCTQTCEYCTTLNALHLYMQQSMQILSLKRFHYPRNYDEIPCEIAYWSASREGLLSHRFRFCHVLYADGTEPAFHKV